MKFKPNRKFRKQYEKIFRRDPAAANLFLLLAELAGDGGQVVTDERQLAKLMVERFKDLREYAL